MNWSCFGLIPLHDVSLMDLLMHVVLQVKQIAGRAGRRGSLFPEGVTTTFYTQDIPYLYQSLQQDFEPATAAGLFPVFEQVRNFKSLNSSLFRFESEHRLLTSCAGVGNQGSTLVWCSLGTALTDVNFHFMLLLFLL